MLGDAHASIKLITQTIYEKMVMIMVMSCEIVFSKTECALDRSYLSFRLRPVLTLIAGETAAPPSWQKSRKDKEPNKVVPNILKFWMTRSFEPLAPCT